MPSSEERLAYLEGRVEEHTRGFEELRASISRLDGHILAVDRKVDAFREELVGNIQSMGAGLDAQIDRVQLDLGGRVDTVSGRIDAVEQSLGGRIAAVDAKVDRVRAELDAKMTRQFTWIVGLQVTMLIAILSVMVR